MKAIHYRTGDRTACGLDVRGRKTTGQVSCVQCRHSDAHRRAAARRATHDSDAYLMRTEAYAFMRELELEYANETSQPSRATYSAFYSFPARSELLVLMMKPGGHPGHFHIADVEVGAHEYIEGMNVSDPSPSMVLMRKYMLAAISSTDVEDLRGIAASNFAWRRASDQASFAEMQDMTLDEAVRETAPYLAQLIAYVRPRSILAASIPTLELFLPAVGATLLHEEAQVQRAFHVYRISLPAVADLPALDEVEVVAVKHPSRPGRGIEERVRAHYERTRI